MPTLRFLERDICLSPGIDRLGDGVAGLLCSLSTSETSTDGIIAAYEALFGAHVGAAHAVAMGSGRLAITSLLKAYGIGAGDEVLVTAFTCFVVPNSVVHTGARPVYVDIDPDNYTMDPRDLARRVTPRSRAVLVQHTFGCPADMDAVHAVAKRHGLVVIEDCAHSLGSTYDGRQVGNLGDAAIFSTERTKCLSTERGGLALTNDADVAAKLKQWRREWAGSSPAADRIDMLAMLVRYLWLHPVWSLARGVLRPIAERIALDEWDGVTWWDTMPSDYEMRLSRSKALVGLRQLRRLKTILRHRGNVVRRYEDWLKQKELPVVKPPAKARPVFLRYPVRVSDRRPVKARADALACDVGNWFDSVVHRWPTDLERIGYIPGSCPNGERAARTTINLPVHGLVRERDIDRILRCLAPEAELAGSSDDADLLSLTRLCG